MRSLIIVVVIIVSLSGCGSKIQPRPTSGQTIVTGQVIGEGSGKPVAFAEVNLRSIKKGTTAMSMGTNKTVYADENGNFFISFEADEDYFYLVTAKANHYFEDYMGIYVDPGINNSNIRLKIQPKGYIKFNVMNEGYKDTIYYTIQGQFHPSVNLNGVSSDSIVYREALGNTEQGIRIRKWTRSADTYEIYNFFLPALDTFEYTIKY